MQPRYDYVDGSPAVAVGNASRQEALRLAAHEHVHAIHRAECVLGRTALMFAEVDCSGLGGDLAGAVRVFAIATQQRRQLVLLPPPNHTRVRSGLPPDVRLSLAQPWHWFAGDPGSGIDDLPFDSIFHKSACQELFEQRPSARPLLEAIAQGEDIRAAAVRLGFPEVANTARRYGIGNSWRIGLTPKYIPPPFSQQGLLWWFQVLTTYLLRVRGPLARLVRAHPAMRPFLLAPPVAVDAEAEAHEDAAAAHVASAANATNRRRHHQAHIAARPRAGERARGGHHAPHAGWMPAARFDAGLHIRVGDACENVRDRYYELRRCNVTASLSASLGVLRRAGVTRGSLFVATNSPRIIRDIEAGGAAPFNVSYTRIDRGGHLGVATQRLSGAALRRRVLIESLIDVLLLSRAEVIAGPMMSGFPRLAMQLRVQPPGGANHSRYVALDGYHWCSRSSCRMDYMSRFHTV